MSISALSRSIMKKNTSFLYKLGFFVVLLLAKSSSFIAYPPTDWPAIRLCTQSQQSNLSSKHNQLFGIPQNLVEGQEFRF